VALFSDFGLVLYAAMVFALLSVLIGMNGLWVRDYNIPGKEIEDFLQHTYESPEKLRHTLVISYIDALTENENIDADRPLGNKSKNDQKLECLRASLKLTSVGLLLILLHPLIEILPPVSLVVPVGIIILVLADIRIQLLKLGQAVVRRGYDLVD